MAQLTKALIILESRNKQKKYLADAMHAANLSRENYSVVLKPGRLMSTAEVTHLLQGFCIQIPFQKSQEFRHHAMVLRTRTEYSANYGPPSVQSVI